MAAPTGAAGGNWGGGGVGGKWAPLPSIQEFERQLMALLGFPRASSPALDTWAKETTAPNGMGKAGGVGGHSGRSSFGGPALSTAAGGSSRGLFDAPLIASSSSRQPVGASRPGDFCYTLVNKGLEFAGWLAQSGARGLPWARVLLQQLKVVLDAAGNSGRPFHPAYQELLSCMPADECEVYFLVDVGPQQHQQQMQGYHHQQQQQVQGQPLQQLQQQKQQQQQQQAGAMGPPRAPAPKGYVAAVAGGYRQPMAPISSSRPGGGGQVPDIPARPADSVICSSIADNMQRPTQVDRCEPWEQPEYSQAAGSQALPAGRLVRHEQQQQQQLQRKHLEQNVEQPQQVQQQLPGEQLGELYKQEQQRGGAGGPLRPVRQQQQDEDEDDATSGATSSSAPRSTSGTTAAARKRITAAAGEQPTAAAAGKQPTAPSCTSAPGTGSRQQQQQQWGQGGESQIQFTTFKGVVAVATDSVGNKALVTRVICRDAQVHGLLVYDQARDRYVPLGSVCPCSLLCMDMLLAEDPFQKCAKCCERCSLIMSTTGHLSSSVVKHCLMFWAPLLDCTRSSCPLI